MDLLNLDELLELERTVVIRGVSYPIVERSVGVMLDSIRVAKKAARKSQNEETFFEDMIKTIRTMIPECPEEVVRGLTMPQMIALMNFVNTDPNVLAEEAVAAAKEKGESGEVVSEVAVDPKA